MAVVATDGATVGVPPSVGPGLPLVATGGGVGEASGADEVAGVGDGGGSVGAVIDTHPTMLSTNSEIVTRTMSVFLLTLPIMERGEMGVKSSASSSRPGQAVS